MELQFVPSDHPDLAMLTQKLDAYYFELVGDVQQRYADVNHPRNFASRVVLYTGDTPIGCGCWKAVDDNSAELKRIYVLPEHRRKGAASRIISALEQDALSTGRRRILLETARTTADSASLYLSLGYREADYYGSPAGAENCLCFEKTL